MTKTVICKDVFGNEYTVNSDELEQRIGVYGIIVKDDKILLTRQWGGYSLPGGGVDNGESLEEAFTRELKEETGLVALPGKMIFHATRLFKKDKASKPKQSFQFYFVQKSIEGEISNDAITQSEGNYTDAAAEWVSLEDAQYIELRHTVDMRTILAAYEETQS